MNRTERKKSAHVSRIRVTLAQPLVEKRFEIKEEFNKLLCDTHQETKSQHKVLFV